jgi:hypothetical protein
MRIRDDPEHVAERITDLADENSLADVFDFLDRESQIAGN